MQMSKVICEKGYSASFGHVLELIWLDNQFFQLETSSYKLVSMQIDFCEVNSPILKMVETSFMWDK